MTVLTSSILSVTSGEARVSFPLGVQPGPGEQHPGPSGPAQLPADGSPRCPQRGREQDQADRGLEQSEPQQPGGESGRPSPDVLPSSEGFLPWPHSLLTPHLCVQQKSRELQKQYGLVQETLRMAEDSLAQVSNFLQKMESAKEVSDGVALVWAEHSGAALGSDTCPCRSTRSWQHCWMERSCP